MQDAWRAYLQLALGLTEASKKRAQKVAKRLVGTSGVSAGQVQAFVEELTSTGAANREALTKLIRFEVDRALGAVGLATAEEVADLNSRVRELERDLADARAAATRGRSTATEPLGGMPTGGGFAAAAEPEPEGTADGTAAGGTDALGTAVVEQPVAKKAVAKKTIAKKAVAKKAVAKKAVAKRTNTLPAPGRSTPREAER